MIAIMFGKSGAKVEIVVHSPWDKDRISEETLFAVVMD